MSRHGIVKPHPKAIEALKSRAKAGEHIAHGFHSNKAVNLAYRGGRTLQDLQFRNIYLGHWKSSDRTSIDDALSAAMMDPNLNHVMQQYFPNGPVTTHFLGSTHHGDSSLVSGATFDRDAVHRMLAHLNLSGSDPTKTVDCLYLPPGVILDTRAKGGVGDDRGERDARASRG